MCRQYSLLKRHRLQSHNLSRISSRRDLFMEYRNINQPNVNFHTSKINCIGKGEDLLDGQGKVVIVGFSDIGFDTSRGSFQQSIITTSDNAYVWKVEKVENITIDSIALFRNLKPRPELVLFGLGNNLKQDLSEEVIESLTKEGILVEKLDTPNACSTFNILSAEGRNVCAALIPISNNAPTE